MCLKISFPARIIMWLNSLYGSSNVIYRKPFTKLTPNSFNDFALLLHYFLLVAHLTEVVFDFSLQTQKYT